MPSQARTVVLAKPLTTLLTLVLFFLYPQRGTSIFDIAYFTAERMMRYPSS